MNLFSPGVTAEVLRVNSDWKSVFSLQRGQSDQKFQVEGVLPPPTILRKLGYDLLYGIDNLKRSVMASIPRGKNLFFF